MSLREERGEELLAPQLGKRCRCRFLRDLYRPCRVTEACTRQLLSAPLTPWGVNFQRTTEMYAQAHQKDQTEDSHHIYTTETPQESQEFPLGTHRGRQIFSDWLGAAEGVGADKAVFGKDLKRLLPKIDKQLQHRFDLVVFHLLSCLLSSNEKLILLC